MANNRIYLKCEGCGGLLFLGKRLGGGYYWHNYGISANALCRGATGYVMQDESTLEDRLNIFFGKHEFCGGDDGNFTYDHFKIVYENDDDFEYKEG